MHAKLPTHLESIQGLYYTNCNVAAFLFSKRSCSNSEYKLKCLSCMDMHVSNVTHADSHVALDTYILLVGFISPPA